MSIVSPPTPIRRVSSSLVEHVNSLTGLPTPTVTVALLAIVDALEARASEEATGSRDFGRGYMHAVRLLRGEE